MPVWLWAEPSLCQLKWLGLDLTWLSAASPHTTLVMVTLVMAWSH